MLFAMLAGPALELLILAEQEFECLTDYVGRVRIDEFCVPVQVVSDFFLQAHLEGCRFRLL